MNLLFALLFAATAQARLCDTWSEGKSIGGVDTKLLDEASGMVASKAIRNRLYWINDSGDSGRFFHSTQDGDHVTAVNVRDFKPRDTEAITYGPCEQGQCIIIGDIGDNASKRKDISLIFIKEAKQFDKIVDPVLRLKLTFPDGPHDAEALAILPNGDLLIVTKEFNLTRPDIAPAGVYILPKNLLRESQTPRTLTKIGELPLAKWFPDDGLGAQVVTDAAINEKRQVLGLLTYQSAIEIPLGNLSRLSSVAQWKAGEDYQYVALQALPQQESMTYTSDDSLLWSTEAHQTPTAVIFSMTCSPETVRLSDHVPTHSNPIRRPSGDSNAR